MYTTTHVEEPDSESTTASPFVVFLIGLACGIVIATVPGVFLVAKIRTRKRSGNQGLPEYGAVELTDGEGFVVAYRRGLETLSTNEKGLKWRCKTGDQYMITVALETDQAERFCLGNDLSE
jgi:hypothetical protein